MKRIIFCLGFVAFAGVTKLASAGNAPAEPRCLRAGPGETNNGYCYNTYDSEGKINGSNCTDPASSNVALNCLY